MNKWWWFAGGLVVGAIVAPKIRALTGGRLPSIG